MTVAKPPVVPRQTFSERVAVLHRWLAVTGQWPSQVVADPDERRLNRWIDHQRARHAAGLITAEERAELERVPGWQWRTTRRADATAVAAHRVDQLRRWLERTGGTYPSRGSQDPAERSLAYWVRQRRSRYQDGTLSADQRSVLSRIPGWTWDLTDSRGPDRRKYRAFEEAWAEVVAWIREHGTPPRNTHRADASPDERRLAHWLSYQRGRYHAGALSPDRRRQMATLLHWDDLLNDRGRVRRSGTV